MSKESQEAQLNLKLSSMLADILSEMILETVSDQDTKNTILIMNRAREICDAVSDIMYQYSGPENADKVAPADRETALKALDAALAVLRAFIHKKNDPPLTEANSEGT